MTVMKCSWIPSVCRAVWVVWGPWCLSSSQLGKGPPLRSRIHAHPVSPRCWGSPKSRANVKAARRLESWVLVPLVLRTGSASWVGTIPPSPGLSCCNVRNGGQIPDTKISHHKERLEVQTNVEPVSGCLTSLCPLVDTSGLAPGGNRLETPELCQGSPSLRSNPHILNVDNNNTYLLGLLLRMQRDNTWEMHEKCLDFRSEHRLVNQQKPDPTTEMANPIISEECNDYKL